jgi:hypothetical protein
MPCFDKKTREQNDKFGLSDSLKNYSENFEMDLMFTSNNIMD